MDKFQMNESKETIDTIIEYLKQAVELAKPQATALLTDYIHFYQVFYLLVAIFMVLIFIGFIVSTLKYRNEGSEFAFFTMFGFGLASILSVVVVLSEFKSVLMCWVAPNIWLIERGLSLLK
jgi:uncharacterized membrane protein YgcG